jgi:hypothetical protein
MTERQWQQQQKQQRPGREIPCPGCSRMMRLVGRETGPKLRADLLTFQCDCGQVFTTTMNQ